MNWERDVSLAAEAVRLEDLRKVVEGDPSPDGSGSLRLRRGIEVGHIFKLGLKYSEPMKATVQDEAGDARTLIMGTYGFGITRAVGAAIEQSHDDAGIVWPDAIAPWRLALVPLNAHKSETVRTTAERLYDELLAAGVDVLLDDRDERPGVKFKDADLVGIPLRITIGEKTLKEDRVEVKRRGEARAESVAEDVAVAVARKMLETG